MRQIARFPYYHPRCIHFLRIRPGNTLLSRHNTLGAPMYRKMAVTINRSGWLYNATLIEGLHHCILVGGVDIARAVAFT